MGHRCRKTWAAGDNVKWCRHCGKQSSDVLKSLISDWSCGSSSRVPALQAQSSKFIKKASLKKKVPQKMIMWPSNLSLSYTLQRSDIGNQMYTLALFTTANR
jgi:hypothetical protein